MSFMYPFKRKPIAKKSKRPNAKAKDRAWRMFSLYKRTYDCLMSTGTKDYGRCITCGAYKSIKDLDAGHFVPGRGNAVLFSEPGVNIQCDTCNRVHGGRELEYRKVMVARHGEEWVKNYEILAKVPTKLYTSDFERIYTHYKQEYEKLTEGK